MKRVLKLITLILVLALGLSAIASCDNSGTASSGESATSTDATSQPSEPSEPSESFDDAELKYAVDRTLEETNVALNMNCSGSITGTSATDADKATTASAAAGKVDFTVTLDGTSSGIGDFSLVLTGESLPEKILLVVSTDELDWYSAGEISGVSSDAGKTYAVQLEQGFRARYLRVIYTASSATEVNSVVASIYQSNTKLYVNAIDNSMFFSVFRENEPHALFCEGQGAIVTEKFIGNYPAALVWNKVICCAPVGDGTYRITAIFKNVGTGTEKYDAAIPEGGFCYCVNLGNDYPTLFKNNPAATSYEGLPNYTTEQINTSFALVDTADVGDTIELVNIDLENGVIVDNFGSYLKLK